MATSNTTQSSIPPLSLEQPSSPGSAPVPKAVLYADNKSPWSSAVLLALYEKGYGDDEFDYRQVDLSKGENLDPTYLRINSTAGVPTLVVPLDRYIGPEIESRYRAIIDPKTIMEFLDKSRTVISKTHTTSSAPAPALAPATIDHLSSSSALIALLHSAEIDPMNFTISATDSTELSEKANGPQGLYLKQRQEAITRHLANFDSSLVSARFKTFWETEKLSNGAALEVYKSVSMEPNAQAAGLVEAFFEKSRKRWQSELKVVLDTVEKTIKDAQASSSGETAEEKMSAAARGPSGADDEPLSGTYILGDQMSLVDLHFFVWLARIVALSGGDLSVGGLLKVEQKVNKGAESGWKLGEQVKSFWGSMLSRESVKKVYGQGIH